MNENTPAASGAAPAEVQRRAVDGIREFYLGLLSSYLTTDQILRVRSDAVTRIAVECNRDVFAALASREASPAMLTDVIDDFEQDHLSYHLDHNQIQEWIGKIRAAALASPQVAPAPKKTEITHAQAKRLARMYGGGMDVEYSFTHAGLMLMLNHCLEIATPVQVAPPPTDDEMREALWFAMDMTNVIGRTRANLIEYFLHKVNKDRLAAPVAPQHDARDAAEVEKALRAVLDVAMCPMTDIQSATPESVALWEQAAEAIDRLSTPAAKPTEEQGS